MVVVSPDPIHLLFVLKDTLFYTLFVLAFHLACRGSYISVRVLLNLLSELGKRYKM